MVSPAPERPHFDHRDGGTPASAWELLRARLPAGAAVGAHDHLLVLAAHPDDETFGAGGLIADAARRGAQVTVVVATDGEASHPNSPTHQPSELAVRRRREVALAVATLAPAARLHLLHRADGSLADRPDGLEDTLAELAGDVTVVAAPWRHDAHPDHETCGRVAASVSRDHGVRLLEYPIWGWHWGDPGRTGPLRGDGWVTCPMSPQARRAKDAALAAHRSQHDALSDRPGDEPVLGQQMLAHAAAHDEEFLESAPTDLPAHYFERLYDADADPWNIGAGFYEHRKRQLLLATLPRQRFNRAFEPGCGQGLTTIELATRCDDILATDVSTRAVDAARGRTAHLPGVEIQRGQVPDDWPSGRFDLIVISELGYYLADPSVLAARARSALADDGVLVACHWRHAAPGYPSSAQRVHDALGRDLRRVVGHVEPDFLLDVWSAADVSVAQTQGLVT